MSHQRISILGITLLITMASFAHAEESQRDPDLPPKGYVFVEQPDVIPPKAPDRDFKLRPYEERRGHWGVDFGFAYSSFTPSNYTPNFSGSDWGSEYGSPSFPLVEGQLVIKRNSSFGSYGVELGYGFYSNKGADSATLKLSQTRIGAIIILDTLFHGKTPYVAPYFSFGAYMMSGSESLNGQTFSATTSPAMYLTAGAQFSLDWIDQVSAKMAYESGGVQSTFVFLEVRSYFASSKESDPNFSSGFAPGGGLRLEF